MITKPSNAELGCPAAGGHRVVGATAAAEGRTTKRSPVKTEGVRCWNKLSAWKK